MRAILLASAMATTLNGRRERAPSTTSRADQVHRSKQRGYWAAFPTSTILGSRIVKVEPRPGSLSTVMSPPIIWQKQRLIARPRPVPPYLLAVAEEAWENSWNRPALTNRDSTHTWCSGANPILKIGLL
jgi:hypothetical protein